MKKKSRPNAKRATYLASVKQSRNKLLQMIGANFGAGDVVLVLGWWDGTGPAPGVGPEPDVAMDECEKALQRMRARMIKAREVNPSQPELRYIAATAVMEGGVVCCHILCNFPDIEDSDVMCEVWPHGALGLAEPLWDGDNTYLLDFFFSRPRKREWGAQSIYGGWYLSDNLVGMDEGVPVCALSPVEHGPEVRRKCNDSN